MLRTALTDFCTGRGKSLAYAGTALALTGAGVATTAAAAAPGTQQIASAARHISVGDDLGTQPWPAGSTSRLAAHAGHAASTSHPAARSSRIEATAKNTTGRAAKAHAAQVHVTAHSSRPKTWKQISHMLAGQTYPRPKPGTLAPADRLHPGPFSGQQAYMQVSPAQMANATTIVRRALDKHMGLRSAVIAVATAMQESTLRNIDYGTADSLGLFQQRPSCGWGSAAQVTDPTYASDAFLDALREHQHADPGWARQPLWANAQAVQGSAFPYAYAKWESQATHLVWTITRRMF